MAKSQNHVPVAPAAPAGNGADTPATDEQVGASMWSALMTPGPGLTFAERWSHLDNWHIGAYGTYRVIREVPPVVTLTGKDAVSYVLAEIPQTEQEGEPVSFFDAIAKAAKPKPHNARRNFGQELFDRMVETFINKYDPNPDSATRGERSAKFDKWAEGFRTAEVDDQGQIDKVDAFLIAEATALRDSEDMRRKSKGKGAKPADTADTPKAPAVSTSDLLSRLTLVDKDGVIGDLKS